MRASTADRERAVDVLKAAFAEGRLDQSEYADRVGLVYSSRTYAELASLTADLPVGPLGTMPVMPIQPGYGQPGYGQLGYGQPGVTYVPVPVPVPVQPMPVVRKEPQTNGMAVAAFVFGLGTFVTAGITAPISIVLAIAALIKIHRTDEKGVGLAVAAVLITLIAILLVPWA
ncbi:MAG TPA: DUF1707 and DUF4190 domain-containing protein [Streptosporangiaceae bacterium]|nr:DUF1707 and DUF4190 domain-containing protein [Streptosporangiaceae bacterium]